MNRIKQLFTKKQKDILNIYFTAGYPDLDSLPTVVSELDKAGVDLIEIGIPYSDPLADGTTIQDSSQIALKNGMTLDILFEQIEQARQSSNMPFILMGYFNPVIQYGEDRFFERCKAVGVDGLIIPDMPLHEYEEVYRDKLEHWGLSISFLTTPQTPHSRIHKIDQLSSGFIYMVSSSSITGAKSDIQNEQIDYFKKVEDMDLANPRLIGFGISSRETFQTACQYANGAIIGSAFIRALAPSETPIEARIEQFIQTIR